MEENIVNLISEAENKALARKAQAQAEAAEIVAAAEAEARRISKASETECANLRRETLNAAEARAASDYAAALDKSRAEAAKYAEELLKQSDKWVLEIVGRLNK